MEIGRYKGSQIPAPPNRPTDRDLRIAYAQGGHGPSLDLLHGGMDDSQSWHWQFDGLADEFAVAAWTRRDHLK